MRWCLFPARSLCGSCLAAFLMSAAGAVRADDHPATSTTSYSAVRHNWDGFYAGIHAGYTWGDTDGLARWGNGADDYEMFAYGTKGASSGLHAGYNHQLDNLIVGIETDISASATEGAGHSTANMLHSTMIDWMSTIRLRLGFASKNTLFYITGGTAMGHVKTTNRIPTAIADYANHSEWKLGWTIGGGIEQALTPKMSLKLGYRYIDLG